MIPMWVTVVLAAAAVVGALGVLWTKVVKPVALLISNLDTAIPLLSRFVDTFEGKPNLIDTIKTMAAEFTTDHGSSLRDVINNIDDAAAANASAAVLLAERLAETERDNARAASILATGVEAAKQLAARDRADLMELILKLDRVATKVDKNVAGIGRVETEQANVAADLGDAQKKADAANGGDGSAADAASRTPEGGGGDPVR